MMWEKKGHIFSPQNLPWASSYAAIPVAYFIPSVNIIRIIYTTRNSNNISIPSFIDVDADYPKNIIYIHDKPIIESGSAGTFDDCGVMPCWLLKQKKRLLLYYIGWNVRNTIPYHNSIGLLVSENDGLSFERFSEGPLIDRNIIDPYFTASACVIKVGLKYKAAYLSCTEYRYNNNEIEPRYLLKYADSKDGVIWERTNDILVNYKSNNEAGIARPSILFKNGKYLMWYSYRFFGDFRSDINCSYRIGFAISSDFKNWKRKDELAGIERSNDGWDSEMIEYPHVIEVKNKLLMFYNGNYFGKTGFGYAQWED